MPYIFLDNIATADVAFQAWGGTLEELFSSAADAVINVMAGDLEAIERRVSRAVVFHEESLELLLYKFLQELVFYKDVDQILLRVQKIMIESKKRGFSLQAELAGEKLNSLRHKLQVDIKAVTMHQLKVVQTVSRWEATVVVDV